MKKKLAEQNIKIIEKNLVTREEFNQSDYLKTMILIIRRE